MIKGKWCAWCSKGCGWSSTHSTKYHEKAMADSNWSVKKLESACPNHPLITYNKAGSSQPPAKQEKTSDGDGGGTGSGTGAMTVNAGQAQTILTQLERGAKSDEARSMIESLRTGLGLN